MILGQLEFGYWVKPKSQTLALPPSFVRSSFSFPYPSRHPVLIFSFLVSSSFFLLPSPPAHSRCRRARHRSSCRTPSCRSQQLHLTVPWFPATIRNCSHTGSAQPLPAVRVCVWLAVDGGVVAVC
ncbi:hypothetical protein AKJ16_DCAP26213 [Drosera capensis]